jgi:hypothetical protein
VEPRIEGVPVKEAPRGAWEGAAAAMAIVVVLRVDGTRVVKLLEARAVLWKSTFNEWRDAL